MKRREFLTSAGIGTAGAALASPALAQAAPELKWRLLSAYPKSSEIRFVAAELFSRYVLEASDGKFQVQPVAPGDVAGAVSAPDAAANGTVEMGHGSATDLFDKDPVYGLLAGAPFGLNTRGQNAWFYENGGLDLANEVLGKAGLYALPGGNAGARMGAWMKRELKGPDDLKGLRMAVSGLAGEVLGRLGALPQHLPAADIAGAFERGNLDAAESASPLEDEKLGLAKSAPFILYPGWWSGSTPTLFWFNLAKWRELPKPYAAIATAAAAYANAAVTAKFDARNPGAIRRLAGAGAQLRPWSQDVLEAGHKAANETYADLSAKSPDFKRVWDSMRAFRGEEYLWFQIAEYTFDNFMIRARARGG